MKIRNAAWAIFIMLSVASAGRAVAGPEAATNLGTLIVYRPWSIVGSPVKFNLNHGLPFTIRNGSYYLFTVLPGDTVLSLDDVAFLDPNEQTVRVEPGQTVYFQYMVALSLVFEEADNQEKAARTVSRLRPLN